MPKKISARKRVPSNRPTKDNSRRIESLHFHIDRITQELAKKFSPSCKKGCSDCCKLLTLIGFAEGLHIAAHLLGNGKWRGVLPRLVASAKIHDDPNLTKVSHLTRNVPCAFLEDNLCSIYSHRPTTCRVHLVLSPPETCSPAHLHGEKVAIDTRELEYSIIPYEAAVTDRYQVAGDIPFYTAPIPIVVLEALQHLTRIKDPKAYRALLKACAGIPKGGEWLNRHHQTLINEPEGSTPATMSPEELVQIRRGNAPRLLPEAPALFE